MFLTVLNSSSRKETNIKMRAEHEGRSLSNQNDIELESEIDEEEISYLRSMILNPDFSDDLERHMVSYTASILQNNIFEGKWHWRLTCQQCLQAFVEDDLNEDDLLSLKMTSSKLKPSSKSTFEICMATEKLMKKFEFEPKHYIKIPNEVLRILHFNDFVVG